MTRTALTARTTALSLLVTAAGALAQSTMPAAVPPGMAAPASAPATAPATQAAEEGAVKAALVKYNAAVAADDVAALQTFIHVSTPGQKQALALMAKLTTAGHNAFQAATGIYGPDGMAKENVDRSGFPSGFPPMPVDEMAVMVTGPKAVLVPKGAPEGSQPLQMTKKDGDWKIDGDALLPVMTDKQLSEQGMILEAAIGAIDQTAADTKLHYFAAPDEAVLILNHRMQKAVHVAQMKLAPMIDPSQMSPHGPAGPGGPPAGPTTAPAGPQMP